MTDLKHIKVRPILMRKGGVKLAIYGLSHVKDERLHRLLRENKVIFTNIQTLIMVIDKGVQGEILKSTDIVAKSVGAVSTQKNLSLPP